MRGMYMMNIRSAHEAALFWSAGHSPQVKHDACYIGIRFLQLLESVSDTVWWLFTNMKQSGPSVGHTLHIITVILGQIVVKDKILSVLEVWVLGPPC